MPDKQYLIQPFIYVHYISMIKWESQNQTNQFIKMNRKVRTVRKHFFHLAVHNGTFKQLRQEFPPRQTVSVQHDRH